jgi:hypothetical protein
MKSLLKYSEGKFCCRCISKSKSLMGGIEEVKVKACCGMVASENTPKNGWTEQLMLESHMNGSTLTTWGQKINHQWVMLNLGTLTVTDILWKG